MFMATITLTESALLIFFLQSGAEKLLAWVAGDRTHNHNLRS